MKMIAKPWRDAATLIVAVKCQVNAFKILMLRRSNTSKFMPRAYVFPGGVKSEADFSARWNTVFNECARNNELIHSSIFEVGQPKADAPFHHSGIHPGIGYRICALRETFEESGLLIANDDDGKEVVLSNPDQYVGGEYTTLKEWQKNVHSDASNFVKLFHNLRLSPAVNRLREWSTWLTPTFEQFRFNTIFYLSCIEDSSVLNEEHNHCEEEMLEMKWVDPEYALSNLQESFYLPQIMEMLRLNRCNTFDELKNFTSEREHGGLTVYCPHLIKAKDGNMVTYPGDKLHNDDVNAEATTLSDTTVEQLNSELDMNLNRNVYPKIGSKKIYQTITWCGHEPVGFVDMKDMGIMSN